MRDEGVHPPLDFPDYKSTALRHPQEPLIYLPHTVTESTGPQLGPPAAGAIENDLTTQHDGEPIGERIIVSGRLLDGDGRPIRDSLIEVWQANAAGRYAHRWDRWPAPLDPNFSGGGRCVTDADGRYSFVTIKPGPTRGATTTTPGARRTSTSRCSARSSPQRLVTQMYFPGDPLFPYDPIFNSVRDPKVRERLIAGFSIDRLPGQLGARLRVRHRAARARRDADGGGALSAAPLTPVADRGPYLAIGLPWPEGPVADPAGVRICGRVFDGAGEIIKDALVETWDPASRSFCRCPTDDEGRWHVVTPAAPHLAVNVFARGLLHRLVTRIYFDPDHDDPVLALVPADPACNAGRPADRRWLPIRHPHPRARRNRLLRRLSSSAASTPAGRSRRRSATRRGSARCSTSRRRSPAQRGRPTWPSGSRRWSSTSPRSVAWGPSMPRRSCPWRASCASGRAPRRMTARRARTCSTPR